MSVSVTRQSVTCQPQEPVLQRVGDMAAHRGGEALGALEEEQRHLRPRHVEVELQPGPRRTCGAIRRPSVAWWGFVGVLNRSTAAADPARSLDVDHAGIGEGDVDAVLLGQGRRRSPPAAPGRRATPSGDRRRRSGRRSAGPGRRAGPGPRSSAGACSRRTADTEASRVGGAKWWSSWRSARPNPSPTRTSASPCSRPMPAGADGVTAHPGTGVVHLDAGDLADAAVREVEALADPDRALGTSGRRRPSPPLRPAPP